MKSPKEIGQLIAKDIEARGVIGFMGRSDYTPNEFRVEIARQAIELDRAQHEDL